MAKFPCTFLLTFLCWLGSYGAPNDYMEYHLAIISAEKAIFIKNDSIGGLKIFKETFAHYDFVFVDDCIEAFQLALYFKKEDYAMAFLKKALQNGFEIKLLDLLNMGCPCNFYADRTKVNIYSSFIQEHETYLKKYADSCYPNYIARINKEIYGRLIKRHVTEQLFKNEHREMCLDPHQQEKEYDAICNDNLRFADSLAASGSFIGERNMGIYSDKQAHELHFDFGWIEQYRTKLMKFYHLPPEAQVPVKKEGDYFDAGLIYNMQYHAKNSFVHIAAYKDAAIRSGYLHPREYASLQFARKGVFDSMHLQPSNTSVADVNRVNKARRAYLLPDYDIDYQKHVFAHQHHLQLFFGFFNGTR